MRIKDHKQRDLFDPWRFLSPKRRRLLDESRPGLFRQNLLDEMPVKQISPFFCEDFGWLGKEWTDQFILLLFILEIILILLFPFYPYEMSRL